MRLSDLDAAWSRARVVDANDGIIATAGIVEGFAGAGASGSTLVIAALSAMVAGGISLGAAKYAEEAAELDARLVIIEEERRQIELSPAEEMAELAALYEAKGLSPRLAGEVARELSARDALAAHADAEHGVKLESGGPTPLAEAASAGLAFAAGAVVPLLAIWLSPDAWRATVTFVAVLVSLVLTSLVLAAAGGTRVLRTLTRSVVVGSVAMLLTLVAGSLYRS